MRSIWLRRSRSLRCRAACRLRRLGSRLITVGRRPSALPAGGTGSNRDEDDDILDGRNVLRRRGRTVAPSLSLLDDNAKMPWLVPQGSQLLLIVRRRTTDEKEASRPWDQ